jgi:hypothetical protein
MDTAEGDGSEVVGDSPEDAFALVANETRFEVLAALWAGGNEDETPLSFSALRERVGLRDSGQFNYHLGKLVPRFVREVEDGYELTHAGGQMIGAAVSGTYTDSDVSVEPVPVGDCPDCDGTIEAGYRAGLVEIECSGCAMTITDGLPAPPVLAAHHDPGELPAVFGRLLRTRLTTVNEGFCPLCGGPVENTPLPFLDRESTFTLDDESGVAHGCQACGREIYSTIGVHVLDHPAVVELYHDHGVDVRTTPLWEFDWLADAHAEVTSEAPPRVSVTVTHGGEAVDLWLDEHCTVRDHERRSV